MWLYKSSVRQSVATRLLKEKLALQMVLEHEAGVADSRLPPATRQMVRSGGLLSLWDGLPPLLLREILFSLPKFVVLAFWLNEPSSL